MRNRLIGLVCQAALMDFSKVFTVLPFESFIASLNKVMLPRGVQPKTLV